MNSGIPHVLDPHVYVAFGALKYTKLKKAGTWM